MKTYEQFLTDLQEMNFVELREALTRTEYQTFMNKGIRGLLEGAYAKASLQTTFQELVTEENSDSNEEDYPSLGDPQMPQQVNEGQNFPVLSPGSPDHVKVTNFKFGGIIEVTRESKSDDKSPGKSIGKQGLALGRKAAEYKDKAFYSILGNNPAIYDTQNFFSLNHPGYTGGATRGSNDNIYTNVTMTANALATVLGMIAIWEGADVDQDLSILAERIVAPQQLQQTAHALTRADLLPFGYAAGPLGPATSFGAAPNMMKGKLQVTVSPRLDKLSTGDWYVKTDFPGLLYQKREGLQVLQELVNAGKSFEQDLMRWRVDERFGRKVVNWRWGVKVS